MTPAEYVAYQADLAYASYAADAATGKYIEMSRAEFDAAVSYWDGVIEHAVNRERIETALA